MLCPNLRINGHKDNAPAQRSKKLTAQMSGFIPAPHVLLEFCCILLDLVKTLQAQKYIHFFPPH